MCVGVCVLWLHARVHICVGMSSLYTLHTLSCMCSSTLHCGAVWFLPTELLPELNSDMGISSLRPHSFLLYGLICRHPYILHLFAAGPFVKSVIIFFMPFHIQVV